MKVKIVLYFLILAFFNSCDRVKPNEPFYCKINGEKFRPGKDNSPIGGIGSNPLRVTYNRDTGVLFISARNSPREVALVFIFPDKSVTQDNFILKNEKSSSKASFTYDNSGSPVEDLISSTGTASITKKDGFLLSGTFSFKCKSSKTGREYIITDGQFNNLSYY